MANKIQFRRGTKAQLTALGPLAAGEPGYTSDTKELVIGNGTGANTPVVTATSADITYYVRTDGSDSNDGSANTAAKAFKTIAKALSMLPKIGEHARIVSVASGTYDEAVVVSGFSGGGSVNVTGSGVTVRSLSVIRCSAFVSTPGIIANTTTADAFTAYHAVGVNFTGVIATGVTSSYCGLVADSSNVYIADSTLSNKKYGLFASFNSKIISVNNSGTGNGVGLFADGNGQIGKYGTQPGGTVAESVAVGIITGGVLNPWGDNTASSRSLSYSSHTVSQILSANTWTKIVYNLENTDNLNEYNPSTSIFTAKLGGTYLITAALQFQVGGVAEMKLAVGTSSGPLQVISHVRPGSAGYTGVSGAAQFSVPAGGEICIWALTSVPLTTQPDGSYSWCTISRIA